jgi:hypothetical protein
MKWARSMARGSAPGWPVHGSTIHGGADGRHGGALTGAWPLASAEHESSPAGVQQREGNVGNPVGGSLRHGQRCGGQVMVRKQPRGGRSATREHGLRERGRVSWGGAVKSGGGARLL